MMKDAFPKKSGFRDFKAARKLKDTAFEGYYYGSLGSSYAYLGETKRAIDLFKRSLKIARQRLAQWRTEE